MFRRLLLTTTVAALFAATVMPSVAIAKHRRAVSDSVTYLPHPTGCPGRAFCGCGACVKLGIPLTECKRKGLFLAANWPRNYRGSARIAVWRGHVAIVDRMTGAHTAMLYDYNSGNHRSRYWERDISRARIIGGGFTSSTSQEYDNVTTKASRPHQQSHSLHSGQVRNHRHHRGHRTTLLFDRSSARW